jgi:hypothetical protein
VHFDPKISLIDSFLVPVCRFARAYRCRRLAEESAFGYDEMAKQTFYGLRAHLRVCWPGVIVEMDLAPANVHDLRMVDELLPLEEGGWVLVTGTIGVLTEACQAARRGGVAFAGSLQVEEEGKGTLAALADAKEAQD